MTAVLASKMIDEAEAGGELLGVDQKTSAVRLPSNSFHGAVTLFLFVVADELFSAAFRDRKTAFLYVR